MILRPSDARALLDLIRAAQPDASDADTIELIANEFRAGRHLPETSDLHDPDGPFGQSLVAIADLRQSYSELQPMTQDYIADLAGDVTQIHDLLDVDDLEIIGFWLAVLDNAWPIAC